MTDFTEDHSEALLNELWRVTQDASGATYLFKFCMTESGCCFLITDTKEVWTEALENRHIHRRYRNISDRASSASDLVDDAWITQHAHDLAALHSPGKVEEVKMAVWPTTKSADLEVRLTSRHHTWKWECMRTAKLGAAVLSQHLILPLITFNEAIVNAAEPLSGMDETTWTKHLDGVAKASRVINAMNVLFRPPRITTSLRRITQIMARVGLPLPIVSESPLEDSEDRFYSEHGTGSPMTARSSSPSAFGRSTVKKHVGDRSLDSQTPLDSQQLRSSLSPKHSKPLPPADIGSSTMRIMGADDTMSDEEAGSVTEDEARSSPPISVAAALRHSPQPLSSPALPHLPTARSHKETAAIYANVPHSEGGEDFISSAPPVESDSASGLGAPEASWKGKRKNDLTDEQSDISSFNDGLETGASHAPSTRAVASRGLWQGPRRAVTKKKRF